MFQDTDLIQVYRESFSCSSRFTDTTNTSLPLAGPQAGSRRTTVDQIISIIIIIIIIIIKRRRKMRKCGSSSLLFSFFEGFFLLPLKLCSQDWIDLFVCFSIHTHKCSHVGYSLILHSFELNKLLALPVSIDLMQTTSLDYFDAEESLKTSRF